MNDLIPFKDEGERVTCIASAAVTGKQFVSISGNVNANGCYTVAPTAAAGKAFGVACWDAAIGAQVTVITIPSGQIVPVKASGVIAAGASVKPGALGVAVAAVATDRAFGICLSGAVDGADAIIQLAHHTA